MNWITNRLSERTSWDGGALIAVGVLGLFFSAVVPINIVCWAAIAWGVVTLLKSEGQRKMDGLDTEVRLLKKELEDQRKIHDRLDVAIEKLTDVSNSIHRMLAVHEEKLARQEEAIVEAEQQIETRRSELLKQISELHSRVTTNTKEIMVAAAAQHAEQNKEIQAIRDELRDRVGILERWRHVLIGASIIAGFVLNKVLELDIL